MRLLYFMILFITFAHIVRLISEMLVIWWNNIRIQASIS